MFSHNLTDSLNKLVSNFTILIPIKEEGKRAYYANKSIEENWSKRELKRQIDSSLYERLLLSEGKEKEG